MTEPSHASRLSRRRFLRTGMLSGGAAAAALVGPTGAPAWLTDHIDGDHDLGGSSTPAAIAGYPHITVPMGFVSGLPVGMSFFGRAWSEPTLLKLAYAFEQATRRRRSPRFPATEDGQ